MSESITIIIAAPEWLPGLGRRVAALGGLPFAFTDLEALAALDAVTKLRPTLVVLERQFGSTPRGTALVNRIKADGSIQALEIRVMDAEGDFSQIVWRSGDAGPHPGGARGVTPAVHLDQRGTRRAPRFPMAPDVEAVVEGSAATVVDLSTIGSQVVAPFVLRPNQRVRVSLSDEAGIARFTACVAWASFEIQPKGGPRYRAGLEFADADAAAIDAFCQRHKR